MLDINSDTLKQHKKIIIPLIVLVIFLAYFDLEALGGILVFFWAVLQYFDTRSREMRSDEFERYHRIIKELVHPEEGEIYMQRQMAALYELRHYSRYDDITVRILESLIKGKSWKFADKTLVKEAELTVDYIKNRKRSTASSLNLF